MSGPPPTPDDVLAYYGLNLEAQRLVEGVGLLEFARTQELILRFLEPGSKVADVGGGTGRYAEWLSGEGHDVELVDPVPLHVTLARDRAGDPPRFGVHHGDARRLPLSDDRMDAVLLLGPLYHLGEEADRLQALSEAARVCRRGGIVVAAAISRYAPLLDTIRRGLFAEAQVFANVERETLTGRRVPAESRTSPFPDAYFHLPAELEREVVSAGLVVQGIFGVEGAGWLLPDLASSWEDEQSRARILSAAAMVEQDPHLIAVSPHLLAIASKP